MAGVADLGLRPLRRARLRLAVRHADGARLAVQLEEDRARRPPRWSRRPPAAGLSRVLPGSISTEISSPGLHAVEVDRRRQRPHRAVVAVPAEDSRGTPWDTSGIRRSPRRRSLALAGLRFSASARSLPRSTGGITAPGPLGRAASRPSAPCAAAPAASRPAAGRGCPRIMSTTLSGKATSTPGSSTCARVSPCATIISAMSPTTLERRRHLHDVAEHLVHLGVRLAPTSCQRSSRPIERACALRLVNCPPGISCR